MPSPRYRREIPARYRLEGSKCSSCGRVLYPARRVCPGCRGTEMERIFLSRKGRVVTSTVIRVPPADFLFLAPYALAIVETPEGARLMVQVADCDPETVRPGMEVHLEFRRIRKEGRSGILCYGHKAVPPVPAPREEEPAGEQEAETVAGGRRSVRRVRVWAELTDDHYRAYECEARRRGVTVESLVQQTVNALLRELEAEEADDRGAGVTSS